MAKAYMDYFTGPNHAADIQAAVHNVHACASTMDSKKTTAADRMRVRRAAKSMLGRVLRAAVRGKQITETERRALCREHGVELLHGRKVF